MDTSTERLLVDRFEREEQFFLFPDTYYYPVAKVIDKFNELSMKYQDLEIGFDSDYDSDEIFFDLKYKDLETDEEYEDRINPDKRKLHDLREVLSQLKNRRDQLNEQIKQAILTIGELENA